MQAQARASFSPFDRSSIAVSRYGEPVDENVPRPRHNELPESWYSHFAEKYRTSRHHRFPAGEREANKRTAEGMSAYVRLNENHKKRRKVFKDDQLANSTRENGSHMHVNSASDMNNSSEDETVLPEVMFPFNCVPDSALPPINREEYSHKVELYGVLDNLPPLVTSRSAAMIERFGIIMPEYLRMGLERSKCRGTDGSEGSRKSLSQEQASQMSQKVIARVLTNVGVDSATAVSMEVLSQLLSGHVSKCGRTLKVLTDSYRKQCSAIELLKMFLQTFGYG